MAWALTEPGSGSDAAGLQTTSVLKNGNYYLNGGKIFHHQRGRCRRHGGLCTVDKSLGHRGVSAYVVDQGNSRIPGEQAVGKDGYASLQHGGDALP